MYSSVKFVSILLVTFIGAGCSTPDPISEAFIFLAHTRVNKDKHPQTINPLVKNIDLDSYSMVLLGGDLTVHVSEDERTMAHVDSIFDFGSDSTLWALGNHDYSNLDLVRKYTGKPNYYAKYHNGLTFVVLDTQEDYSNIVGDQLDLLKTVADTISSSSHLIILHHKLIWWLGNPALEAQTFVGNAPIDTCFDCLNTNNFYQEVYPLAQSVQRRGVQVLFVAGDVGFRTSRFEHHTSDSIVLLANGLHGYRKSFRGENRYLIFEYDQEKAELNWRFKALWMDAKYDDSTTNKISRYRKELLDNPARAAAVFEKAQRKGNTFNEQLQLDAIRMNVPSELEAIKAEKRLAIKRNKKWYYRIMKDAKENGNTLEDQIEINIQWMLDNDQF